MSSARSISGTPLWAAAGTATITVTDVDGDTDTLSFDWTTYDPLRLPAASAKSWTQNRATVPFGVAAAGGVAPLAYSVGGLPAGVTASSSGSVSGTPTGTGSGTATVSVTDAIGNAQSGSFTWRVAAEPVDRTPSFATVTVPAKSWTRHDAIAAFTVPAATGGDGTLNYAAGGLPSGVSMDSSRTVSGTPDRSGSGTGTVTATDADGDTATVRFAWTVSPGAEDLVPLFGSDSILNRDWIVLQSTTSFTVPAAMGGDGAITYAAEGLPDGVTMSAAQVVTGRPTATGFGTARITAQDADGDFATLAFHWTVTTSSATGLTANPNPSTDGSFIVSGSLTTPDPNSYLTYQIIETEPDGAKITHDIADPKNISLSFSSKSDGIYSYRMQRCDYFSTSTLSRFVCTDIGSSLSVSVTGGLPKPGALMSPDTDADGTYTIAWSAVSRATRYELQQSRDGGAWTDTSVTGTPTTKAFTVTESGEYQYRIRACDATRCSDWSAIKMVLVTLPPTVGFDSSYVARTGDLGSDGDTDIYLSPLATGTGNVGEFILRNDDGTFALEADPSDAQVASAQSWTVSTQLEIVLEDVNVDGVWDALVTGITDAPTTALFEGAVDQIVVSPTAAGGKPTGLVAVDNELKGFVKSVMAWYLDTTHFDKEHLAGSTYFFGGAFDSSEIPAYRARCYTLFGYCYEYVGLMSDFLGSEATCVTTLLGQGHLDAQIACTTPGTHFYVSLAVKVTTKDFSRVSLDVGRFVTIWEAGETRYQVEDLADVLEDVLDITISGVLGERIDEIQQSLFNLYALFGPQGRGSVDIPANKVIVTKRRVGNLEWAISKLNWHAALELLLVETYDILGHNPTIAAYEESNKLVANRNDPSERNNPFAGTVTLDQANHFLVWVALTESERRYCDNLDYGDPREYFLGQLGSDEYNSNGFAAGIIRSIGAMTDAPISTYFLGHKPVPSSEFVDRDCNAR